MVPGMDYLDATATLADGRRLGYAIFGDPAGLPVVHFHGALMSRWEGFWLHAPARAAGVRLISVDRPGIGNSDMAPGRRVSDWPRDVEQLAAHLSLPRFTVLGVSGGGPYALACAAALADRVRRVLLVAGAAPLAEPEVFALMSRRQRTVLGAMMGRPRLMRSFIFALKCMPDLIRVLVLGAALGGLSPADLRLVKNPELAKAKQAMPACARQAPFGASVDGPAWDGHLHSIPWGFELSAVRVTVDLWYADDDRIIPPTMGRWLAARLPARETRVFPDDGHISLIIGRAAEYFAALVQSARAEDAAIARSTASASSVTQPEASPS